MLLLPEVRDAAAVLLDWVVDHPDQLAEPVAQQLIARLADLKYPVTSFLINLEASYRALAAARDAVERLGEDCCASLARNASSP